MTTSEINLLRLSNITYYSIVRAAQQIQWRDSDRLNSSIQSTKPDWLYSFSFLYRLLNSALLQNILQSTMGKSVHFWNRGLSKIYNSKLWKLKLRIFIPFFDSHWSSDICHQNLNAVVCNSLDSCFLTSLTSGIGILVGVAENFSQYTAHVTAYSRVAAAEKL